MSDDNKVDPIIAQLRQARLDCGIKQKNMSELVGVGASVMSAYENGATSPQLSTVREWARQLSLELGLSGAASPVPSEDEGVIWIGLDEQEAPLIMGALMAAAARTPGKMGKYLDVLAEAVRKEIYGE